MTLLIFNFLTLKIKFQIRVEHGEQQLPQGGLPRQVDLHVGLQGRGRRPEVPLR
jgi:hypothetical protein